MKVQKSLFACALVFAFATPWVGATPQVAETPVSADVLEAAEAAVPTATEISAAADCATSDLSTPAWLGDPEICGRCSLDNCDGMEAGYVCSLPGAPLRTCQPLGLCGPGGPPLCRCRPALTAP